MADPNNADRAPEGFGDLPMQPTGSGVADLEIAYETMRLGDDTGTIDEAGASGAALTPTENGDAAIDSAAHPS